MQFSIDKTKRELLAEDNMSKSVTIKEPKHRGAADMGDEETGDSSDEGMRDKSYRSSSSSKTFSTMRSSDLHMLTSYRSGESKVEKMARKIERRLEGRVQVTFNARRSFLKHCRKIAIEKKYPKLSIVKYSDIKEYYQEVKEEAEENDAEGNFNRITHWLGFLCDRQCLKNMVEKAEEVGEEVGLMDDDDFHFQEFNFFHTVLVSRFPWMRHTLLGAFGLVIAFYFFTPILFCVIMGDEGICPSDAKVYGWVSALYFASTTMSTVGYGDLTVEKDEAWKVAIGLFYMIASMLVALTAFSAAIETPSSPIKTLVKYIASISPITYPEGPLEDGEYLYQRVRKVKAIMVCDVVFQFTVLNMIGILASQAFINFLEVDPRRQWSWADSAYWAVQTTTTIGYGDLNMPHYMRLFQIFYLTLGTYFTGNALGRLAALKEELEKIRRYHAFERREVNKHMMHFLASTDDPYRVDQYEFVIASLLNLRKIDADDIEPIMEKFRKLAQESGGQSGYISVNDIPEGSEINPDDDDFTEVEGVEGA